MEEPLRYHRTFGLNAEQLDELEVRIEDILPEPWDKGIGRPKSLPLREAIMVTLLYKRQNITQEVIADVFGISQGTSTFAVMPRGLPRPDG
jgi:Helix-turn-helix of DDE superfamily endonuclease